MKNVKILLLCLVLTIGVVGCQEFKDSITGNSSTKTEYISDIKKAENIQTVYWACIEEPNNIETNKAVWISKYGIEVTEAGIAHFNKVVSQEASKISGVNCDNLTPEQRKQIADIILKMKK